MPISEEYVFKPGDIAKDLRSMYLFLEELPPDAVGHSVNWKFYNLTDRTVSSLSASFIMLYWTLLDDTETHAKVIDLSQGDSFWDSFTWLKPGE